MALSDKDVDETMAADWAVIQDKYRPDETEATEAETATAETETTAAAAPDKGEGAETIPVSREADGKFKAQDKGKPAKVDKAAPQVDKAAAVAKGTTETPAAATTEQPVGDQPQARDINRAPSTWKPAARAEFDKLSPAVKAEIHRREADFQNGQAQLLPDAQLGKEMRSTIEPYRMLIETSGATPQRLIGDMLRQAATMRTGGEQQKYQTIAQIANFYGIDLRRFAPRPAATGQQQPTQQPQQFQDPRVDQLLAHQREQEQRRAADDQRTTESTVTRWMNEVDAQGQPKREYLSDVINEMSALVPQIRQTDPSMTHAQALDAAYERAIWAHPDVRALLVQKQQTDLDAQRRSDNQVRVREARRAGSVNVPRRASSPSPAKPGSLEDTIASTARELGLIT